MFFDPFVLPSEALRQRLQNAPAVLVQVVSVQGSAPREPGAWMAVFADALLGTIGGGQLEWRAQQQAQQMLADWWRSGERPPVRAQRLPLGPAMGQCCGGAVHLSWRPMSAEDAWGAFDAWDGAAVPMPPRQPLAIFGAGHVGQALVRALAPLPFDIAWFDSRERVFPERLPPWVQSEVSEPVQAAVAGLAPGSQVLVMSFSHAEDLALVEACLLRLRRQNDLPFVGLIGSRSKWASFRSRLVARGFSESECQRITCPIGLAGIAGKQPEVLAASVVAQLLLLRPAP